MSSPTRREQHSIRRPFAQKHSAIPNSQSHVTYGRSFKTRAWLLAYHFSTLEGCTFAPAQNPAWGLHRSQRSEAPICCALRNWSTRACHDRNQVAAVVSWWDLVTAWFRWWVGERNRGWESTEERKVSHQDWRETSHILEALLIPATKQQVFQFTLVKKTFKVKA